MEKPTENMNAANQAEKRNNNPIDSALSVSGLKDLIGEELSEKESNKDKFQASQPQRFLQSSSYSEASEKIKTEVFQLEDYLNIEHQEIAPLIGTESSCLLVPGEGLMIPGTGGVGKTFFVTSVAVSLTIGESILGYEVSRPLNVLIYQAEIPAPYYQQRLRTLYESYHLVNPEKASSILGNLFIAQFDKAYDIAAKNDTAVELITTDVVEHGIDVVIIDPFLSFFQGNENDNNEVRRALDNLKHRVAQTHNCGLIITDHQPKYSGSNEEQKHSMRGAGAKKDWAASIIALNKKKTPVGQHGTFISATIDKMRYGPRPTVPFTVRRDDFSFRHFLFRDENVESHEVAEALDHAGGGLSKNNICKLVKEEFSLNSRAAVKAVERAVEENFITTEDGDRNATIHNVGENYVEWRKNQQTTVTKTH